MQKNFVCANLINIRKYFINNEIRAEKVRVIDETGHNLDIMNLDEALKLASERGLDLILIAQTANPPVTRIMDWGKFQYEEEKQARKEKQKVKGGEVKIIRFGLKISEHDLVIRAKKADEFLEEGHKVRVEIFLRGREKAHPEIARVKFDHFFTLITKPFKQEQEMQKKPQGFSALIIQSK